jgi:hypothetical protein
MRAFMEGPSLRDEGVAGSNPATPTKQKQRLSRPSASPLIATPPDIPPETLKKRRSGKYTIELCAPGGPDAGIEGTIARDDDLATARRLYRAAAADNPDRVVLLCDRARILAWSDRRDDMPS